MKHMPQYLLWKLFVLYEFSEVFVDLGTEKAFPHTLHCKVSLLHEFFDVFSG